MVARTVVQRAAASVRRVPDDTTIAPAACSQTARSDDALPA